MTEKKTFNPTIVKASESTLAWVKILVMGLSGAGKTTFLATMKNALILQVEDQGIHSIRAMNPEADVIHVESWDHLSSVFGWILKEIKADRFPYEAICLDSIHDAQGLLEKKMMGGSKDKIRMTRDEYGLLASRTMQLLDVLKRLPRHVIVSTMAEEFQDGDELKVRPGGVGKAGPSKFAYHFNVVAYAFKRIPESGGRPEYFLLTDGASQFLTKGHPCLDPVEVQNCDFWIRKILEGKGEVLTPADMSESRPMPEPPKPEKKKGEKDEPPKRGGSRKGAK